MLQTQLEFKLRKRLDSSANYNQTGAFAMTEQDLPSYADVLQAAERIKDMAVKTPLLYSQSLNERIGGRVFFKAENLQHTGSFKFRGAYNKLLTIPDSERGRGVIACSSGNHAQGVAMAAKILNISATIVMPFDAPTIKLNRTKELGAKVVLYDRETEDREQTMLDLCDWLGAIIVHPYDDFHIIAGQGTSALEAANDLAKLNLTADNYLVCTGGGGLTAGSALALEGVSPKTRLFAVEPEEFDDHRRSFSSGIREKNQKLGGSICDALLADQPGRITFAVNKPRVKTGLTVSDKQAMEAVAFAFHELKLVVEPGGAAALAAILSGKLDAADKTTVVVLSGGNIDGNMLADCLKTVRSQSQT